MLPSSALTSCGVCGTTFVVNAARIRWCEGCVFNVVLVIVQIQVLLVFFQYWGQSCILSIFGLRLFLESITVTIVQLSGRSWQRSRNSLRIVREAHLFATVYDREAFHLLTMELLLHLKDSICEFQSPASICFVQELGTCCVAQGFAWRGPSSIVAPNNRGRSAM